MPKHYSPLIALGGLQGNQCASPRVFGAKGDGIADDTSAIQNTINALKLLQGGGTLILDGIFRTTSALAMSSKVSLEGVGSAIGSGQCAAIFIDSPTSNILEWAGFSGGFGFTRQRIKNVLFGAKQSNSGKVIATDSTSTIDLLVDNVTLNEGPLSGLLASTAFQSSATSRITFTNCEFNQVATGVPFLQGNNATDALTFRDCRFQTPNGSGARMVDMQAGRLGVFGCDFLAGSSPVGSAAFLHTGPSGLTRAVGNTFRATGGSFPAFTWQSGAFLKENDNTYEGSSANFTSLTGTPAILAPGSRVQPMADFRRSYSGSTWDIDDYVENFSFEATGGSGTITLNLPRKYFAGQRCRVLLKNATGSSLTPVFVPYNPLGGTNPALSNGQYAYFDFVVSDTVTSGTYTWYLVYSGYN